MDTGAAEEFGRIYGVLAKIVEVLERVEAMSPAERDELKRLVKDGQDRVRRQSGGVQSAG